MVSCVLVTCDRGDDDDDDEWEDTDEEGDFDSEGGFSGDEDMEGGGRGREFLFMDEETKSRFTEYSMTSSVMRRNEQLTLLDDRFEKVNVYAFFILYDQCRFDVLVLYLSISI